jgi:uncharacterized protein YndB with AHSA1/START domain
MIDPIQAGVSVGRTPEDAFRIFTQDMGTWWPLDVHSIAVDELDGRVKAESIVCEGGEGGRIFEVMSDGAEADWATITTWDPPRRVVLAWKPNLSDGPSTELEVTFRSEEPGRTRVELTHRGWERLGDRAQRARESYGEGWQPVLERYAAGADA